MSIREIREIPSILRGIFETALSVFREILEAALSIAREILETKKD